MNNQALNTEKTIKNLSEELNIKTKINKEFVEVIANKNDILKVLKTLRKNNNLKCDNLHCISGVDYPDYIEVVYHLYSYSLGHKVVVKVKVDKDDCKLDSVYSLWKTADWQEREIYDLYGAKFIGHPNLKRILLNDEFKGHPFRKDYPLEKDEEWLLEDPKSNKNYGVPDNLEELYKSKIIKNNGEKNK